MTMPGDIGAIDLMISFPKSNASKTYDYLRETTRGDDESTKEFPAGYMFKDVPNKLDEGDDGVHAQASADAPAAVVTAYLDGNHRTAVRTRCRPPGRC